MGDKYVVLSELDNLFGLLIGGSSNFSISFVLGFGLIGILLFGMLSGFNFFLSIIFGIGIGGF